MSPTQRDPVVDEIRAIRHRISAQFDHDPARIVAYYQEIQRQFQDRLIQPGSGSDREGTPAA
jgi:hypothetical protein